MEKIIPPGSWDFGEQACQIVKYSSRGLTGKDYDVLVKRAGEQTANWLRGIDIDKDQVPVHVIALGSTEGYNQNRNADGYKEAALKLYHDTFVKKAHPFRHHANRDPEKRYGNVKASTYNNDMRRVELLIAYNANNRAVEKFGGHIADKELELLNSGKDLSVSQATTVPYDVCTNCGNKAKNRKEYCDETNCISPEGIKRGGCKDHLCQVYEDGYVQGVDNPHLNFFDISYVHRPADQTAYGGRADLEKSASYELLGGAALAEQWGITAPLFLRIQDISSPYVAEQVKLAYTYAAIEDTIENNQTTWHGEVARAFTTETQPPMDLSPLGTVGTTKFASGLAALASQNIAMPVRDFLRLVLGESSEKYAEFTGIVPNLLPGIYNRLITGGDLESMIRSNPYTPSRDLAPATQREWAHKLASDYTLDLDGISQRARLSAIRQIVTPTLLQRNVKLASALGEAEKLAQHYALYKLAFMAIQPKIATLPLTHELLVLQNYVIS